MSDERTDGQSHPAGGQQPLSYNVSALERIFHTYLVGIRHTAYVKLLLLVCILQGRLNNLVWDSMSALRNPLHTFLSR